MDSAQTDGQKRAQIRSQIKDIGKKARRTLLLTIVGCTASLLVVIGSLVLSIVLESNLTFVAGFLMVPVMLFTRKAWNSHCEFKFEGKLLKGDMAELNAVK